MPDDNRFGEFLRRETRDYHAPVPPPADAMWARIESDVAKAIAKPEVNRFPVRRVWLYAGAGLAAALLLGVAIGRWSAVGGPAGQVQVAQAPVVPGNGVDSARRAVHVRASTLDHLAQTEMFLTGVRADLSAGRIARDGEVTTKSLELLTRTRLLLDATEDRSPAVEQLLQDLELLLAEIAAMPSSGGRADRRLLEETMRQGDILPRIRTTLPAQPARI